MATTTADDAAVTSTAKTTAHHSSADSSAAATSSSSTPLTSTAGTAPVKHDAATKTVEAQVNGEDTPYTNSVDDTGVPGSKRGSRKRRDSSDKDSQAVSSSSVSYVAPTNTASASYTPSSSSSSSSSSTTTTSSSSFSPSSSLLSSSSSSSSATENSGSVPFSSSTTPVFSPFAASAGEKGEAREQQDSIQKQKQLRRTCPYLGTIKRHLLDFDFEKICSICLSNQHVYACLVCARYFQGRGKHTYAHMHALQEKHYVYINLKDCRVYCLPDNYEVKDASLDDIIYNLRPTYSEKDVRQLSSQVIYGKALDGTDFIPGCVGLNNLKATDFCNVLIQAVCAVIPLRSWLLLLDVSHIQNHDLVLVALGELIRKIFNAKNFKGIVSPHEFLQAVGVASKKKFRIGQEADPLNFFCWLMHRIQKSAHHVKINSTVVEECFQGEVLVKTTTADSEAQRLPPSSAVTPFLMSFHRLDWGVQTPRQALVKMSPLFPEPCCCLEDIYMARCCYCCCSLWKLPKYLLLHLKRFSKNNFYVEKNPTIATFPVKHLDLRDYIHADAQEQNPVSKYNLVANICHQGKPHDGRYKVHVLHAPTNEWFEIEDLRVTQVLPQFVALSESYMQIYQRQDIAADGSIDAAVVEAELQDMRRKAARAAAATAAPDEEEDIFAAAPEDEEEEEEGK